MKRAISVITALSLIFSVGTLAFAGDAGSYATKSKTSVVKKKVSKIPKDPIKANYYYVKSYMKSMVNEQDAAEIIEAKENKSDMKLIKSSAYQSEYSALMEDFMDQVEQSDSVLEAISYELVLVEGSYYVAVDNGDFVADKDYLKEITVVYKDTIKDIGKRQKAAFKEIKKLTADKNKAIVNFKKYAKAADVVSANAQLQIIIDTKESIVDLMQDIIDMYMEAQEAVSNIKVPDVIEEAPAPSTTPTVTAPTTK